MKSRSIVALALAGALLAGACSSDGQTDLPAGATEVTLLIAEGPEEMKTFQAIADAFNASQSDVHATIVPVSEDEDIITRLSTDIASGNAPDTFFANYRYVDSFAAKDLLVPITDRLAASTEFTAEDFYPVALDAYNLRGEQYCMPFNASNLVVYYNEDLFEQAGIDEPGDNWTWKEMVAAAKATTGLEPIGDAADGETTSGVGVEPQLIRLMPFVHSAGGEFANAQEDPTKLTLTSLPAQKALTAFLGLHNRDEVAPSAALTETEGLESLFANGRLAMYMDSRKVVPGFRLIEDFAWDVAPLPRFEKPATILHSDGYCITSGSKHPDEAWEFIEFAVSEEGQRISAESGRAVPSLISVAESKAFLDPATSPSRSQVFLDQLPYAIRVPVMEHWVEIEDLGNAVLEEGFFEGEDAPEVGDQIDRQAKPLLQPE